MGSRKPPDLLLSSEHLPLFDFHVLRKPVFVLSRLGWLARRDLLDIMAESPL